MSAKAAAAQAASFEKGSTQAEGVASGTWTIGAEAANVRLITLQLKDANGAPMKEKKTVRVHVWSTVGRTALATGGSTGIEVDTGSVLIATHTAKLVLEYLSDANGLLSIKWTDIGTESVALEAICDGVSILSAAFANT